MSVLAGVAGLAAGATVGVGRAVATPRPSGPDLLAITAGRRAIAAGTRVGPRWTIGRLIWTARRHCWEGLGAPYVGVATAEEARLAVRDQKDLGTTYLMPGFGLHDELALLSAAGLSNQRVLRAATAEPARHLGRRDAGTVERGKVADLALLDADPLRDIRNTTRAYAVAPRTRCC